MKWWLNQLKRGLVPLLGALIWAYLLVIGLDHTPQEHRPSVLVIGLLIEVILTAWLSSLVTCSSRNEIR